MNLILLFDEDFVDGDLVRLTGRRREHVMHVHRAAAGDELVVGVCNGRIGRGVVTRLDDEALEMRVTLDRDPPPALPVTLILALPRPKVLNRVIASATSLGVKRMFLINSWRVEKSYWKSPKLSAENLRMQCVLGLEQAKDTVMPSIELRRFFREFVEGLDVRGAMALYGNAGVPAGWSGGVPPPRARRDDAPPAAGTAAFLAIGPEGGFIEAEIASLERAGFQPFSLGPRVLRVETAIAALIGRLY